MKFSINWIEHKGREHFSTDSLRRSLDKGTSFVNRGDTYGDGAYEIEFRHRFEADSIYEAIEYTRKYLKNTPHDIEVFTLTRTETIITEEFI